MDLSVRVNSVRGNQMAAKVLGRFGIDGHEFRFTAIAFGRIGGQNIGAKISKSTEKRLTDLGYDVEEVIITLQRCLLQGDLTIPEGLKRESFADD